MSDSRNAVENGVEFNENKRRVSLAIDHVFQPWLLAVLHNKSNDASYQGMPEDGKSAYKYLENKRRTDSKFFTKNKITADQMEKILPNDGTMITDTSQWDINIICVFLKDILPKPCFKKNKPCVCTHPEHRLAYYTFKIKIIRNDYAHHKPKYSDKNFNDTWKEMKTAASGLPNNSELMQKLDKLKDGPLDSYRDDIRNLQRKMKLHEKTFIAAVLIVVAAICIQYPQRLLNTSKDLNPRVSDAIRNLKNIHIQQIGSQKFNSFTDSYRSIERFAVDLEISDAYENNMFPDAERFYHINKRLQQHGTTTVESLVHRNSSMILLQGSGGTGKTFMLHTAALNWARGVLWRDVSYVLLFTFRKLNLMNATSFHELLHLEYPFLFENTTFEELFSSKHKVVILLDGMDEFAGFEDIQSMVDGVSLPTNSEKKGVSNALFDIMNPHSRIIPRKKVIITSRPITARKLMRAAKQYLEWSQLQVYDILGFGERQVDEFIDHFNNDKKRARKIKTILRKSDNLMLMSRIPAYLRGLCEIYQNDELSDELISARTTTEIFIGQLAMYFHKHYRTKNPQQVKLPLMDIFKINTIQSTIQHIAELAKVALLRESILVDLSETNGTSLEDIEIAGLLSVIKTPVDVKLEFNHMLLQEFLTALHYLSQNETIVSKELFSLPQLEGCLHLYAGLQGALLEETNSPEMLVQFLQNLQLRHQNVNAHQQLAIHYLIDAKRGDLLAETMFEYHNQILVNTTKTADVEISFTSKSYFSNNFHLLLYFLHHHSLQFPNFQLSVWFDDVNDDKFNLKYAIIAVHVCKSRELFVPRTKISTKKWNDFLRILYDCRMKNDNNKSLARLLINDIIVDSNVTTNYLVNIMSTYTNVEISNPLNTNFLRKLHQTLTKTKRQIKRLHLFTGARITAEFSTVLSNLIVGIETVFVEHIADERYTTDEIEHIVEQLNYTLQQTNTDNIKLCTLTIDNTWKLHLEIHKNNRSHVTTWHRLSNGKGHHTKEETSVYYCICVDCVTFPGILYTLSVFCALTIRAHHKTKKIIVVGVTFAASIMLFGPYFESQQYKLQVANYQMKFIFSDL